MWEASVHAYEKNTKNMGRTGSWLKKESSYELVADEIKKRQRK
jgi:hypothetical protein